MTRAITATRPLTRCVICIGVMSAACSAGRDACLARNRLYLLVPFSLAATAAMVQGGIIPGCSGKV